ncbi:MAG: redoxin domain-containing protein [Planctomycetales bacterium]|nr:redoxin domain-containing protein [Planctomycetales bacterium]
MRRAWIVPVLAFASAAGCDPGPAGAGAGAPSRPAAPEVAKETRHDFQPELQKLTDAYDEAEDAFWEAFDNAATDAAREKLRHPASEYVPRFRDLAARARGTKTALDSHVWLLGNSGGMGEPDPKLVAETTDTVLADFIASPDLEDFAKRIASYPLPPEKADSAYRLVVDRSPHRKVKAAAMLSRANAILQDASASDDRKSEGASLMASLIKDFSDTPYGAEANGFLFEKERLQLGMEIPDFEATDQDGMKFRLSEYRGKIVVVDFWGFW